MKAISLWQPWASLIACGAKPYETRHWAPPRALIGQTIAIHAAKKIDKDAAEMATDIMFGQWQCKCGEGEWLCGFELADKMEASWGDVDDDEIMGRFGQALLPIGVVVCTARLDAAFQLGEPAKGTARPAASVVQRLTSRAMPECFTVRYDDWGDYSPGRWAWLLRDVKPLPKPPRVTGAQGFFDLPQGWLCA